MSTSIPPPGERPLNPARLVKGDRVGPYEIVRLVGRGGFGSVYEATRDGRSFALKTLAPLKGPLSPEDQEELEQRFEREFVALKSLRHPNVVRVHALERWPRATDGFLCLVMDFVEGDALYRWRDAKVPSLRRILSVFRKVALAIHEMNARGIFHRDLKSENVLVRASDEEPVIIDFGVARTKAAYELTCGAIVGTPSHFAPEYVEYWRSEGWEKGETFDYGPPAEIHTLGFMLYECLSGAPPYGGEATLSTLEQILEKVPDPLSKPNPAVPPEVSALAAKLLAKRPEDRFQTGNELAIEIQALLDQAGPSWDAPFAVPPPSLRLAGTTKGRVPKPPAVPVPAAKETTQATATSFEIVEEHPASAAPRFPTEPPKAAPRAKTPRVKPPDVRRAEDAPQPPPPPAEAHPESSSKLAAAAPFRPPTDQRSAFQPPDAALHAASTPDKPDAKHRKPGLETELKRGRAHLDAAAAASFSQTRKIGLVIAAGFALVIGILLLAAHGNPAPKTLGKESLLAKVENAERARAAALVGSDAGFGFGEDGDDPSEVERPALPIVSAIPAPSSSPASASAPGSPEAETGPVLITEPTLEERERILHPRPRSQSARGHEPGHRVETDGGQPPPPPAGPSWLKGVPPDAQASANPTADGKTLGIPTGAHLHARLLTNLDSRTVADGPAEAVLTRAWAPHGEVILPARTMLYGEAAATGGGRFTVRFTRLRFTDDREVRFQGIAFDPADKKPGLAPSRRIAGAAPPSDGVLTKVAKVTAGTLLNQVQGSVAADTARASGQTVLDGVGSTSNVAGTTGDVLLLDPGVDFEVFVKDAF